MVTITFGLTLEQKQQLAKALVSGVMVELGYTQAVNVKLVLRSLVLDLELLWLMSAIWILPLPRVARALVLASSSK
jgi:hypothetical protein